MDQGWAAVWAGAIQAVGTLLAALCAVWIAVWQWNRSAAKDREKDRIAAKRGAEEATARRDARIQDMLVAILADIRVELVTLKKLYAPDKIEMQREKHLSRLREGRIPGDAKDMPQAPTVQSFVFENLKRELELLPREVITEVVAYYKYDQRLNAATNAFSAGLYEGLSDERQSEAVGYYLDLARETLRAAETAEHVLSLRVDAEARAPEPVDDTKPNVAPPEASDGRKNGAAHV